MTSGEKGTDGGAAARVLCACVVKAVDKNINIGTCRLMVMTQSFSFIF